MGARPHRPSWFDLGLAAALAVGGFVEAVALPTEVPGWVHAAITATVTLGLAWRRQFPLTAVALALAGILVGGRPDTPFVLFAAMVVVSYTVGLVATGVRAIGGLLIAVGPPFVGILLDGSEPADLAAVGVIYGGAWVVGSLLRQQIRRADGFAVEAAAIREADAERRAHAAAEERVRIARELHDIVSHAISVIAVQTQAVRRRLPAERSRDIDDLRAVETTARQAMAEMRRLLGILRADEERPPLAPQPGLVHLSRLVEQTRSAGLPVEVDIRGEPADLSPGLDLTAYRVIQESLTNAMQHAGPTTARVLLRYSPSRLEIRVEDAGPGRRGAVGGFGLLGMEERVAVYGGILEACDAPAGGFTVRAVFPLASEARVP